MCVDGHSRTFIILPTDPHTRNPREKSRNSKSTPFRSKTGPHQRCHRSRPIKVVCCGIYTGKGKGRLVDWRSRLGELFLAEEGEEADADADLGEQDDPEPGVVKAGQADGEIWEGRARANAVEAVCTGDDGRNASNLIVEVSTWFS